MASVSVLKQNVVPGLHVLSTLADLQRSSNLYNPLPSDEVQPPLLPGHSQALQKILVRHKVQDKFGIHLIHGHFEIPNDQLSTDGKLVAYEYQEGRPIDVSGVDPSFFDEIFGYLVENNLTDIFGLQALYHEPLSPMVELVLGNAGTVMLDEAQAQYGKIYRTTGWCVGHDSKGEELKDGDKHAETTKGTHRVFFDKEEILL